MPQFFFHFCNSGQVETDDVGLEFDSAEQAYLETVATARALWPELLDAKRDPARCAFEVADANGEVLFRLDFDELLDGCRPPANPPGLKRLLRETDERAQIARNDVRQSIEQVRNSLEEFSQLMGRLSNLGNRSNSKPTPPGIINPV